MLSARAYSFRAKSRLAISLSWIGGYVNAIAWMTCGAMVSHMSGNATHFGQALIDLLTWKTWYGVGFFGMLLGCFLLGAMLSGMMIETARRQGARSKFILPMAVEAVLLGIFTIGVDLALSRENSHMSMFELCMLSSIATLAMGLQNATITKISGSVVRTTHVTGVITDLGIESVQYLLWLKDTLASKGHGRVRRALQITRRQPAAQRLFLLASIWGSFLFGATVGCIVYLKTPVVAFAPPVLFLSWIIFVDWKRPIADVRELDLLSDPELKMMGLVKALLPPDLGIYRLASGRHDQEHHAPNFQLWLDHIPRKSRVIILALSPFTRFDANSVMDLNEAVLRLRKQSRTLILAGVKQAHYRVLDRQGATDLIGMENLCPDLEFAVARGLDAVRGSALPTG